MPLDCLPLSRAAALATGSARTIRQTNGQGQRCVSSSASRQDRNFWDYSMSKKLVMAAREKFISKRALFPEEENTKCADDLWDYIEAHEDELEDLEEYARKRGLPR